MVRPGAPKKPKDPNDGPHAGTSPISADLLPYCDTSKPEFAYLGHFRKGEYVEAGHNEMRGMSGVSKKISKLMHEGKPQKQAVAMAMSMKRAGRLTKSGGYRRVGK